MVIIIKNIKKENCKNPNHKNFGKRLFNGDIICLDCRQESLEEQTTKIFGGS